MRSWVPVQGTAKGKLVEVALAEFGARGYADVGVAELARGAGVTIGSLYHHFGSKAGLYGAVREDVERRVLDRMEGALAARPDDLGGALLIAYDHLVRTGLARLLAEPHPDRPADPVQDLLSADPAYARILTAAWRAALTAAADASRTGDDPAPVRSALARLIG